MAAAKTWVAEFSSAAMSSGESGFGSTLSFVYFMISDFPKAVLAAAGGRGGAVTGEQGYQGPQLESWASLLL